MNDTQPKRYDLLIENATVIDGTGAPRRVADVAVTGDRIEAVGDLSGNCEAAVRRNASGLVLAPGFIDAHTHDDRAVLSSPDMRMKVSQGVTTVIGGNCGVSLAPLTGIEPPPPLNLLGGKDWYRFASMREYTQAVDASPPAVNIAVFAGHTTLRAGACADLQAPASAAEIDQMTERLAECLDGGCIGLSTGLAYPPALNAPTDEVVALCDVIADRGGIYATHMRNEKEGVIDSINETIDIGKRASVPVVISHHKCTGRPNWGKSQQTLALIEAARAGQTVDLDVYPYTASSTVLIEAWVGGAEKVLVTWSEPHPEVNGMDLSDICAQWGLGIPETVTRLQPAGAIYFQMDEADLQRILCFDRAMVGSDGLPHDAVPHPRLWGTFPRVLGHYSRDLGLLSLEQAINKMTGIPAGVFGLSDRGEIRPGACADLVLLDPDTVIDRATFETPTEPAAGIEEVWVNGTAVWRNSECSGARPGRMLRREAA